MAWPRFDPSQCLGLAGFTLSTLACAAAARANGRPWFGLAMAQVACWFEVLIGLRLMLHDLIDGALMQRDWYASRSQLQVPALAFLSVVALAAGVGWLARRRSRRARPRPTSQTIAIAASGFAVLLFAVESVSLHAVDRVMYQSVGPFLLVAVLWFCAAGVVALAAIRSLHL